MNLGLPLLIKRKHMFHKHKSNFVFFFPCRNLMMFKTSICFTSDFKVAHKLYGASISEEKINQNEKEKVVFSFHK